MMFHVAVSMGVILLADCLSLSYFSVPTGEPFIYLILHIRKQLIKTGCLHITDVGAGQVHGFSQF